MKKPEMLQMVVIYCFFSYEIVFQVIQKKKLKIDHTHIHNGCKIWQNVVFLFKNYY